MQQAAVKAVEQESARTQVDELAENQTRQETACLLCRASLEKCVGDLFDTRFGIPGTFEAWRCLNCGLEQIYPAPTSAELGRLYESYYNFGGERGTSYTRLREWFFSSWLYRAWIFLDGDISFHGREGAGRLLDAGCNEGRGLKIYARNGFRVEGLELNPTAAAVAREGGFTVHVGDTTDFTASEAYDVVVLSNVLEHAPDPRKVLNNVRENLNRGGQLWISCPNSRSWLRKLFGRSWINWHVPFHISHFSAESLSRLLVEAGFQTVETRQITPALWVTQSCIARMFAKEGAKNKQLRNPFLTLALMVFSRFVLFPLLWLGNRMGRGDCLLVVATKA
ncbi:MAG: class I SAM-dependent methyltransferase [Candidatus Acidiferrum sp.]